MAQDHKRFFEHPIFGKLVLPTTDITGSDIEQPFAFDTLDNAAMFDTTEGIGGSLSRIPPSASSPARNGSNFGTE